MVAVVTDLYRFFDASGRLLYVGISLHAAQRASQHRAEKAWWPKVARMEVERVDGDRSDALAAELAAIQTERPIYNIAGAIPGTPAVVAYVGEQPDGLLNWFVHAPRDHPLFSTHQGQIRERISDFHYLVQWFSWWDGCPTNAVILAVDEMAGWKFYDDHEDFLAAGDRVQNETNRLLGT